MELQGETAITGMAELRPAKEPGKRTSLGLFSEAAGLAIRDAGLKPPDIDGLIVTPPFEDTHFMWPAQVAEYLKLSPRFLDTVELGGASGCGSVIRAALAVGAGLCRHCLCLSGGIWRNEVFSSDEGKIAVMSQAELDHDLPYGPMGFNSAYALIAHRHMHQYGTTPAQMARIAVDQRRNALLNPDALFNKKAITVQDVLNSPLIVDPLHLLEIVLPCTGAAALIVSRADEARDMPHAPVYTLGVGEACTHNSITYAEDITLSPIRYSAAAAFKMAKATPADIEYLSLYDCYPITVIITLEDAGFCAKGDGGPFVESHDFTWQGDLPMNAHGGQLSFGQPGYAGGTTHVTEAIRQLRGEAGPRQVSRNRTAFVNGNGGIMSTQCSLVLGKERV
jgi:acetyl-CoA C-acetyltransferase